MNYTLKALIGIAAVVFLAYIAYFGSYLPIHKSALYIDALSSLSQVRTWNEFVNKVKPGLDAPSPIGQEELVRNTGNLITNIIGNLPQGNKELVDAAVAFMNDYYKPILERGRGMSFNQDVYIMGIINETAFKKTMEVQYLEAADNYFTLGLKLSPERPQFLYGKLDIYMIEGNKEAAKSTIEDILKHWPNDPTAKLALSSLQK